MKKKIDLNIFFNEKLIKLINSNSQTKDEEINQYNSYKDILNSIVFSELTQLFQYISNITSEIGSNNFLICYIFPKIINLQNFLSQLVSSDVKLFGRYILERIYSSKEYQIAATAYFLTIEGRNYFLNISNIFEKQNFLKSIQEYLFKYNKFKYNFDEALLLQQIYSFLDSQNFPTSDSFELWEMYRKDEKMSLLAEIAIRIINMPCSEIPVERLFSHLKYLYGSKNYQMSEDLLHAQLTIRMENIFSQENN